MLFSACFRYELSEELQFEAENIVCACRVVANDAAKGDFTGHKDVLVEDKLDPRFCGLLAQHAFRYVGGSLKHKVKSWHRRRLLDQDLLDKLRSMNDSLETVINIFRSVTVVCLQLVINFDNSVLSAISFVLSSGIEAVG